MNIEFKKLNNAELTQKVKDLVARERKLTAFILTHISEVDRRRLYLDLSYSSLFEYLVKEIGYSAGAAQRRIDAARLSQKMPEISQKIENGVLSLNQISKFSQACRAKKKNTGKPVDVSTQRQILNKIEKASPQSTELIIEKEFGFEVSHKSVQKVQADESVRIEICFSKQEMEIIRHAQALLSHATGGDLKSSLLHFAQLAIRHGKPKAHQKVIDRDKSCQHVNKATGERCTAKYFLEVDHIIPKFAGGGNEDSNLRVLCRNHNQQRYREGSNIKNLSN